VGADHFIRTFGDSGHFCNAESGGIREIKAIGGGDRIKLLIDFLFDVHHFENDLNHNIRIPGRFLEIQNRFDSGKNGICLRPGLLPLFHIPARIPDDGVHPAIDEALFNIPEANLHARLGANLCNAIAHQSRA